MKGYDDLYIKIQNRKKFIDKISPVLFYIFVISMIMTAKLGGMIPAVIAFSGFFIILKVVIFVMNKSYNVE